MGLTPLQTALQANSKATQPLSVAPYRGAETAARFSDPQREFAAIVESCGIYDLGFRARISLKGSDRVRWMNGMVTNNIRDLAVGGGVYAFLLNPQGHILGDMYAYNAGETIEVETDQSSAQKILATFDHYIIMDDVEVLNPSESWTALGLAGSKARTILNAAGIRVPELDPLHMHTATCECDCGCINCTVIRNDNPLVESYELWLAPNEVLKTWSALISASAIPVGSDALEIARIAAGIPLYGVDIRERDLPQETEQARALNFNKGCYVGQEIVERIRSRGNVHRKFTGFQIAGVANVAVGDKIVAGEKEVGEITSVAVLHNLTGGSSGEKTLALGYIRREAGTPGHEVRIGAATATVAQLPFENIKTQSLMPQTEEALLHKV
jgi:folate-binding protein YgfZ